MSRHEDVEVIQGRLGWESGDISQANTDELEPHPKNREIYGDTESKDNLDDTFVRSIREKGVLEPLVITEGKKIISGHRRWLAAKAAGLESIPVRYSEFDDEYAEREAVIEFNRQREKTPGQIVNEFEEILAIERERAKDRKEANLNQGNSRGGNISTSVDEGKSRDIAAEHINADVSGRTLEKGLEVKRKAKAADDEPEHVREAAKNAWNQLENGDETFHGAYTIVKKAERQVEEEPETTTPELPDQTYRTLVIDPPWDMEKSSREERPDQGKYLDYPTMDIDEIFELPVEELAADSGAHVYLWTTHKYLPAAFRAFEEWDVRYECTLTWIKPTGMTPFSWQYNTEFVLFGRFGDSQDLMQKGLQLSIEAPNTKHSEKPDEFYERVRTASPGPRLEMFARGSRDGFDVWGDEA